MWNSFKERSPKHLRMGTVTLKQDKETEDDGKKKRDKNLKK